MCVNKIDRAVVRTKGRKKEEGNTCDKKGLNKGYIGGWGKFIILELENVNRKTED